MLKSGTHSSFALRALAAAAAASFLASCALAPTPVGGKRSKEYFSERDYGVRASPRVAYNGNVPKGGGRYMVGKSYRVAGKTYIPRDNPKYKATGLASWYGDAFHGRLTANGEVYDVGGLTAAHPTMPLPSYARVTNLRNNRSVVVRINDRGPFARGRIIDVSETAAEMLGFKRAGTAKVKVEYVGPARMDGLDHNMLIASYKAPGIPGQPVMIADDRPTAENLVLAAAPAPRARPNLFEDFEPPPIAYEDPLVLTPATAAAYDDPLAPLILRESFAASYAPADDRLSAAHIAAANLAGSDDLQTALFNAVARKRSQVAEPVVIQIATFSDRKNAAKASRYFGQLGRIVTDDTASGSKTLRTLRVVVDDPQTADDVIAFAAIAGFPDAFVVPR